MTRPMRVLVLTAAVALAFLAAVNVGSARPDARQYQNLPPCAAGQQPTFQNPCAPQGGTQQPSQGGQQPYVPPCQAGQTPTMNNGIPSCIPQQGGQQQGGQPQGGQPQGGMPTGGNVDWGNLPACAAGTMPSPQNPCKFEMAECGPEGPPKLVNGQLPPGAVPCRPKGAGGGEGDEMGGFDAMPTADIQKDMKNKFMVIRINVQGSGEKNGSFDVTFVKVEEGVGKGTRNFLNEQLEGESFVIETTAKTKCFADTDDPDKIPDLVSCKQLDDAADNAPGSIKAQFRGKVSFDQATYTPKFAAQKIVFNKGTFNVAKIS